MHKQNISSVLVLILSIFFFASCSNEPVDPNLVAQLTTSTNSGGGTTPGGGGSTSVTGDYWPSALNNEWVLTSGGTQNTMKMISVDNIGGFTYYTFNSQSGLGSSSSVSNVVTRLRKDSGDYYLKVDDMNITGGGVSGTMTGYEMILLKDYLNVNSTWNGSFTQTVTYTGIPAISMNNTYLGTIIEKNVSLTVNGVNYNSVIKVKIHQEVSAMGSVSGADTYYWFAKNIGIIKSEVYQIGSSVPTTSELVTYHLY